MKIQLNRIWLLCCLAGTIIATGCQKDYLSGGSLHVANTPLNNIDYMKSNQLHLFDTTVAIIQKMGLTDEVNNAKTFFAFTDYSLNLYMVAKATAKQLVNPSAVYTIDSLAKDITADSIRQYMFSQTIELATAQTTITPYTSLGNTPMGVMKILQTAAPYTTNSQAPTYLLYFGRIKGGTNDIATLCQTEGIKTSNGNTTLHVLANTHTFARF